MDMEKNMQQTSSKTYKNHWFNAFIDDDDDDTDIVFCFHRMGPIPPQSGCIRMHDFWSLQSESCDG